MGGDFDPDTEEYAWWWSQPMTSHTCGDCGVTFEAQASRGPLGRCDGCADTYERGGF